MIQNLQNRILLVSLLWLLGISGLSTSFAQVFTGDLTLNTQSQVDNFAYSQVTGNLVIDNSIISNLLGLSVLDTVGGNLVILNTPLTNLDELINLESVGGLVINNNDNLININGLSGIDDEVGLIVIQNNDNLLSINGLLNLMGTPSVDITNNPALLDINGLQFLSESTGFISISRNNQLVNLDGLSNLKDVASSLEIFNNQSLGNANGLLNLENVGGQFVLAGNPSLNICCGVFPFVNDGTVGTNIFIENNAPNCNNPAVVLSNGPCTVSGCGAGTVTKTFTPLPSNQPQVQSFTVPTGVTSLNIEAIGADGGAVFGSGNSGGRGDTVMGMNLTVTPGEVFFVLVGQPGAPTGGDFAGGAGGGGGTFVFQAGNTPILIAGGGGGASLDNRGANALSPLTGTGSGVGGGDAFFEPFTNCLIGYGGGGGAGFLSNGGAGFRVLNGQNGAGAGGNAPLTATGGMGGLPLAGGGAGGDGGIGGGAGGGATDFFGAIPVAGGGGGGGGYEGGFGGSIVEFGNITAEGGIGGESFISPLFGTIVDNENTNGVGAGNAGLVVITYDLVEDQSAPEVTCNTPLSVTLDAAGTGSITTTEVESLSSDNCGITDRYFSVIGMDTIRTIDLSCDNLGDTTLTLIVRDAAGNTDTCESVLTVKSALILACPDDVMLSGGANCEATINGELDLTGTVQTCDVMSATATFEVTNGTGGTVILNFADLNNYPFPVGSTFVNYKVTTSGGEMDECTFQVIVTDATTLTINCPADLMIQADLNCEAEIGSQLSITPPNQSCLGTTILETFDIDGNGVNLTNLSFASLTTTALEIGTYTIKYRVEDNAGGMDMCSFELTVESSGNEITIACPSDEEETAGANCEAMLPTTFTVDPPSTTCATGTLSTSFESTDQNGVVTTFATLNELKNHSFSLGIHTIKYIAVSTNGGMAMCDFTFTVNPSSACFTITFEFEIDVSADLNTQVCNCQTQCVTAKIVDGSNNGIAGEQLQLVIDDGSANPPEITNFPMVTDDDGIAKICFENESQIPQTIQVSVKRE